MRNTKSKTGFTIVEVMVAVVLIGLAIVSIIAANCAFTQANGFGTNLSIAEFLMEQARERTFLTDFNDLHSLDDATFSPPAGADGQVLNDFAQFSQHVAVENLNPENFQEVVPDFTSGFVRVTVDVVLNSRQISSASWVRAQY